MITENKINGFAILCDGAGLILEIVKDEIGFQNKITPGSLFFNYLEPESRYKFLDFIIEIKSKKIAFGHLFNLNINNHFYSLVFIGILIEDKILIITSDNESDALLFMNEIQQINNEQANAIRFLMKNLNPKSRRTEEDHQMLDDITMLNNELINLQRELAKKNIELQRLNELKNRFLGMAVHDLRNPLNIIHSYCEILEDELDGHVSEKHIQFLNNISNSSDYMLLLVNELIDIAKMDSGKIELDLKTIRILPVIVHSLQNNKVIADKKNIAIRIEADEQQFKITADIQRMSQVFNNLIGNAIKFSYPGSEILIKVQKDNEYLIISVIDYGVGIKPELKDMIFEPFANGLSKGTMGEKGTGLGLAIVKRIVEAHQGELWVESEPGNGSIFKIKLPIAE